MLAQGSRSAHALLYFAAVRDDWREHRDRRHRLCSGGPVLAGLDLRHPLVKDPYMTSETSSAAKSRQDSVVLANFDSYRHAEHMLASLGRGFRTKARKGGATAVVVRGNPDGSLKVTESRVLEAGDLVSVLMRLPLSWMVGFMGLFSAFKGAKSEARAAHVRKGHAGSDEHRAHQILADAGPHAAIVLVRCKDPDTRQMVAAAAADSARVAGMARSRSSSPPSTPVAPTIGHAPLSASPPARNARRVGLQ